jgi:hypothetical protein
MLTHIRWNKTCSAAATVAHLSLPAKKQIKHRNRRSVDFKCQILDELFQMERDGILFAQKLVLESHSGVEM